MQAKWERDHNSQLVKRRLQQQNGALVYREQKGTLSIEGAGRKRLQAATAAERVSVSTQGPTES